MVARMPSNDGLSRRVDALLDLLAAASLDTIDNSVLDREHARCTQEMKQTTQPELPHGPQAWDRHIDKMVRQLRDAVKDTPERTPPEESTDPYHYPNHQNQHQNQNTLTRYQQNSYRNNPQRHAQTRTPTQSYAPQTQPQPNIHPDDDDDRRQYLEREFSSTSYPKIGPGYSDSISVVSELTIPTVVPGRNVPDEEDYSRPPPSIGMTLEFCTKPSRSSSRDHYHSSASRATTNTTSTTMPTVDPNKPKARSKTASYSNAQSSRRPADVRPPPQHVTAPIDAAQRRRQSHQATMAHLGERPGGSGGSAGTASTSSLTRSYGTTTPYLTVPQIKNEMTVNDFPSLNESPNFFAQDDDDAEGNGRRSLLRKPDKYARAVPTASSRMLLSNQNSSKAKKPTKYGIMSGRRKSSTDQDEGITSTAATATAAIAASQGNKNIDLDGVLSTMGQDIDFIFRELTALEEDGMVPIKKMPEAGFSESNIGATAKIKNTLGSVEKYLRKDGTTGSTNGNTSTAGFQEVNGGWPSAIAAQKAKREKADPLLIDEDGFIISADPNDNPFGDPFAMQPMETSKQEFGFDADFFHSSLKDTKPKNTSRTKTSRRSSEVASSSTTKKKSSSSSKGSKSSSSKGPDKESRIDAVELATKKKIDMLRQLVAERVGEETRGGSKQSLDTKLDFVEAETMKQIARLRDRMGENKHM